MPRTEPALQCWGVESAVVVFSGEGVEARRSLKHVRSLGVGFGKKMEQAWPRGLGSSAWLRALLEGKGCCRKAQKTYPANAQKRRRTSQATTAQRRRFVDVAFTPACLTTPPRGLEFRVQLQEEKRLNTRGFT